MTPVLIPELKHILRVCIHILQRFRDKTTPSYLYSSAGGFVTR